MIDDVDGTDLIELSEDETREKIKEIGFAQAIIEFANSNVDPSVEVIAAALEDDIENIGDLLECKEANRILSDIIEGDYINRNIYSQMIDCMTSGSNTISQGTFELLTEMYGIYVQTLEPEELDIDMTDKILTYGINTGHFVYPETFDLIVELFSKLDSDYIVEKTEAYFKLLKYSEKSNIIITNPKTSEYEDEEDSEEEFEVYNYVLDNLTKVEGIYGGNQLIAAAFDYAYQYEVQIPKNFVWRYADKAIADKNSDLLNSILNYAGEVNLDEKEVEHMKEISTYMLNDADREQKVLSNEFLRVNNDTIARLLSESQIEEGYNQGLELIYSTANYFSHHQNLLKTDKETAKKFTKMVIEVINRPQVPTEEVKDCDDPHFDFI